MESAANGSNLGSWKSRGLPCNLDSNPAAATRAA
ncbi:hypothetical protein D8O31_10000 [Burkholderia mallei]|nr:hypothetical protein D8O31_10000 [Burkholderia mallei]